MIRVLRTMKKVLIVLACTILVTGLTNANILKAEEEMPTQQDSGNPTETTTTTTDKNSWSEFLSDESNDQTVIEKEPEQLTTEQQMQNIEEAGAVGQSKDVFNPEETQDDEEENIPEKYEYTIKYLDCDGNVIREETLEADTPTEDVVVKAEGCVIPKNPDPRPTTPDTSTTVTTVVYDNTPAAPWYVYLGAAILVVGIAYCIAKPSLAKKAVKQH